MGLWEKHILPSLTHFACSRNPSMRQREKVVPLAGGRVLEVGIGSGLNLAYYDSRKVTKVWGLDPSPEMRKRAENAARSVSLDVEMIDLQGKEIPLDDHCVDTVLITYTLCTIPETASALDQMARVLVPGGSLLFCEHGISPDPGVRRWQNRLNPIWKRFGGGCNLNRDIPGLLEEGGFTVESLTNGYIPGWRPACFNYWGQARVRVDE